MDTSTSLRWALYYRVLALASFLVGAGVAAVGLWAGLYEVVAHLAGSGTYASAGDALAASRPLVGATLLILGGAIWQVGKTAAFYKTLTEATESQVADRFDTETVKSEILSVMDERLSDLHADVDATRRQVDRLGREDHAGAFDVDGAADAPETSASERNTVAGDAGPGTEQPDRPHSDSRPNR